MMNRFAPVAIGGETVRRSLPPVAEDLRCAVHCLFAVPRVWENSQKPIAKLADEPLKKRFSIATRFEARRSPSTVLLVERRFGSSLPTRARPGFRRQDPPRVGLDSPT